jgi:flagellar hook-basal body complex protein FliE
MISGIESTYNPALAGVSQQMQAVRIKQYQNIEQISKPGNVEQPFSIQPSTGVEEPNKVTFGSLIGNLVEEVDAKGKTSASELKKVMTGEVDNLHQSMIAMQEASVAFTLMVEVRNKLMESYQQIMRMQA